MPTAEASEAEWPLGGATMPHSFGFARRRTPSLKRAQVCHYRSGRGHYRTGVPVDSEIGTSTRSGLLRNRHFAFARLGLAPDGMLVLLNKPCLTARDEGRDNNVPAFVVIKNSRSCSRSWGRPNMNPQVQSTPRSRCRASCGSKPS
jgi:hypothetical protein